MAQFSFERIVLRHCDHICLMCALWDGIDYNVEYNKTLISHIVLTHLPLTHFKVETISVFGP